MVEKFLDLESLKYKKQQYVSEFKWCNFAGAKNCLFNSMEQMGKRENI